MKMRWSVEAVVEMEEAQVRVVKKVCQKGLKRDLWVRIGASGAGKFPCGFNFSLATLRAVLSTSGVEMSAAAQTAPLTPSDIPAGTGVNFAAKRSEEIQYWLLRLPKDVWFLHVTTVVLMHQIHRSNIRSLKE